MDRYIVVRSVQSTRGGLETTAKKVEILFETLSPQQVATARQDPDVEVAEAFPVCLIEPFGAETQYDDAWGIAAIGADKTTATGANVRVAVLDTGIDTTHPAFAGVSIIEKDFTGTGDGDRNGHGTHRAGTIFGRDINGKRIGVARGVTSALVGKVLDSTGRGTSEMIVRALQWVAAERADVVSMSLGFDFGTMVEKLVTEKGFPRKAATSVALRSFRDNLRAFDAAIDFLAAQAPLGVNTLVVAAAGNDSRRRDTTPYTVAASLPADARGVLCVGAVGEASGSLEVGSFSNTFPKLVAPGVSVLSAAMGGGLKTMSGTSMACPHAAGVAALWVETLMTGSRKPATEAITARLISSARKDVFASAYDETNFGYGLIQAPP